jgi:hypothetical protein
MKRRVCIVTVKLPRLQVRCTSFKRNRLSGETISEVGILLRLFRHFSATFPQSSIFRFVGGRSIPRPVIIGGLALSHLHGLLCHHPLPGIMRVGNLVQGATTVFAMIQNLKGRIVEKFLL